MTPGVEGREGRVRFGHVPIFAFPVFLLKIDGRPTAAQMDAVLRFPLFFFFSAGVFIFSTLGVYCPAVLHSVSQLHRHPSPLSGEPKISAVAFLVAAVKKNVRRFGPSQKGGVSPAKAP